MTGFQQSSADCLFQSRLISERLEDLITSIDGLLTAEGISFGEDSHLTTAFGHAKAASMLLTFGVKCPLECAADAAKKEPQ